MKRLTKPLAVIILVVLGVILGGIVTAKAAISDDIGVRWWRMNKAHEGAEIARALGGDNTGGAIKGNRIDLCVATHSEALAKGVIDAEVWRVNG